jgi:hypothetical protein
VRDVIDAEDEDEEGEDLFGPGVEEYASFLSLRRRAFSR